MTKILVIGASGQLGLELTTALCETHGNEQVIATDIREPLRASFPCTFEVLNAMDKVQLETLCKHYKITQIYHLAAILSAKGEDDPLKAWELNIKSLLHVLDIARNYQLDKVFWPSSIAVFGHSTPKDNTPQETVMSPTTVYGISKLAGERWCEYYNDKFGVDVRSLRYPGLIGYKALPGGGTTDYAIDIYYKALQSNRFECFLSKDTLLPMMYMDDAVKATINLMNAEKSSIKIRSSYNIAAISISPEQLYKSIKKHKTDFEISYCPDFRQAIADSWPNSIDDTKARNDWGWIPTYDLDTMTKVILTKLEKRLGEEIDYS